MSDCLLMNQMPPIETCEIVKALVKRDDVDRNPSPATTLELCNLAGVFLASLDVSHSSRWTYRRALKAFFDWVSRTGRGDRLEKLTRFDILAYKDHLISTRRPATANIYLLLVQKFYAWLEEQRICPDIGKGIKRLKKAYGHTRDYLTVEQVRRVLAGIDRNTQTGKRNYAIVNLMARTGLRVIEVSRARMNDIRQESGERVLWVHGKGRTEKDDFVVLVQEAMGPIKEWMNAQPEISPDAPLFPSLSRRNRGKPLTTCAISRIVKHAMRKVGIDSERLTPHSLRLTLLRMKTSHHIQPDQIFLHPFK
jgi:integrase/recombinase XerC/integrase/recombinase XerD